MQSILMLVYVINERRWNVRQPEPLPCFPILTGSAYVYQHSGVRENIDNFGGDPNRSKIPLGYFQS